ncbi:hypothetical protein Ancab_002956 [Ancistrocladus abbreviatus]
MNFISRKSVSHFLSFSSPQPLILRVSFFSTSSPGVSSSYSSSSFPRRQDEESRNVRVSVWWDFENCSLPAGVNVFRVAHSITAAIRTNGIKGPVQITAFGDVLQLSRSNQEALSSTGINLIHIPNGGKNSADRSLLVDLLYWVSQNAPPAHLFLISGDRDFAGILHKLRMNNYNILLASQENSPSVLCSAASIMWHWNALVRGEDLVGKHFNQPPDGPFHSWYGHFKMPLEDPYAVVEQVGCSRADESSDPELSGEAKVRPVPKAVLRVIHNILRAYPKGLAITELRAELAKSNISIDRDFYGHKKFSRFLSSMPHILKLKSRGDGQYFVRGVFPRLPEPVECNTDISTALTDNGNQDSTSPTTNGKFHLTSNVVDMKASFSTPLDINVKDKKAEEILMKKVAGADMSNGHYIHKEELSGKKPVDPEMIKDHCPPTQDLPSKKVADTDISKAHDPHTAELSSEKFSDAQVTGKMPAVVEQDSASGMGFFRRIWTGWFSGNDNDNEKKASDMPNQFHASIDSHEKLNSEVNCVEPTRLPAGLCPASCSSGKTEGNVNAKRDMAAQGHADVSNSSPGFLSKIMSWFKLRKKNSHANVSAGQSGKESSQISNTRKSGLFLEDSIWSDVEAFIATQKGSNIVLSSRSREQIAQNMQKDGPLSVQSLSEADLFELVDLLISEKKWIHESPSQTHPFRVVEPAGNSSASRDATQLNGLRSISLGSYSKSDLGQVMDQKEEKKNETHLRFLSINSKKPVLKSRTEILADCQKLLEQLLKENPEGFNISCFRRLFLQSYGYILDCEKLGYPKLASLLQVIPGVKIESSFVLPASVASRDSSPEYLAPKNETETETSEYVMSWKDDDSESPWEELGPVENSNVSKKEMNDGLRKVNYEYESSLSDDDLSDPEQEVSLSSKVEAQSKARLNHENSSLLQILDSWYSTRYESNRRDCSINIGDIVDCSRDSSRPSGSSRISAKNEPPSLSHAWRQRPVKSYAFVSDLAENDKGKLIDGILGSLKKSGESKMQG